MHYYFCYESNFLKLGIGLYLSPVESKDFGCGTIFPPPPPRKKKLCSIPMIPFTGRQFPLLPPYTLLAQKRFKSENFKVQSQLLYMECHDLSALKNFGLKFWKMLLLLAFCTPPPSLPSTCNVELWTILVAEFAFPYYPILKRVIWVHSCEFSKLVSTNCYFKLGKSVVFSYFVAHTDMRSYDCLIGWQAHEGEVCSMQFSADETTAYSMGTDGKVSHNARYSRLLLNEHQDLTSH